MSAADAFLDQLAQGIILAGGVYYTETQAARHLAEEVWQELKRMGTDSYPCLVELHGLRYIYQWDLLPPVVVVMRWEETMWQDMAVVKVPRELAI